MTPIHNIKLLRICVIFVLVLCTCCLYFDLFLNDINNDGIKNLHSNVKKLQNKPFVHHESAIAIQERIVHLDLKGAPPRASYFVKIFPLLSELGATGILIEYEDMFPYNGLILYNISSLNVYCLDDFKNIEI